MIATAVDERQTSYQASAINYARRIEHDGRTIAEHIEIVWANFCDVFPTYRSYLVCVAGNFPESEAQHVAKAMVKEHDYKEVRKTLRGKVAK